jgi:hypothetical protein
MRTFAVAAIAAATLFCPLAASAQDDEEEATEEEEGDEDMDALMASDPERAEPKAEEAEDDEAPPAEPGEQGGDDERPPGGEEPAESEPKEAAEEVEDSGGPAKPISIGVLAGYGLALDDGANPWSAGFGLRGGYNIGGFYVGARFVYHVGETVTELRGSFAGDTSEVEVSANLWELGAEAGYDIRAGEIVVIRPELGVGLASVSANNTQTVGYIAPGLALLFDVSPGFFLGIDARYAYVGTTLGESGLGFFANLGLRF